MVCTTLAAASRPPRSSGRRARHDRERQADPQAERQRGHAHQHVAAEIIRQSRQGFGETRSRWSSRGDRVCKRQQAASLRARGEPRRHGRTGTASGTSEAGGRAERRRRRVPRWPAAASITAVERATLNVADGEFVAIVGPTGCGKSTLLNIAAGLLAPSAGRVDIFGAPLAALNRQAGYLFQADALFPWKTALENVAIGLETAGTPQSEARARAQGLARRASASAPSATAIRTCCPAASASASGWRRC